MSKLVSSCRSACPPVSFSARRRTRRSPHRRVTVRVEGRLGTLSADARSRLNERSNRQRLPTQVHDARRARRRQLAATRPTLRRTAASARRSYGGNWSVPWKATPGQCDLLQVGRGESRTDLQSERPGVLVDDHESAADAQTAPATAALPGCVGAAASAPGAAAARRGRGSGQRRRSTCASTRHSASAQRPPERPSQARRSAAVARTRPPMPGGNAHADSFGATLQAHCCRTRRRSTRTTVCVHNGNDGNCGTAAPGAPAASDRADADRAAPYSGPYAVVARRPA